VRQLCEHHFDLKGIRPVFTYGDTIYNPHNLEIDAGLEAHETAHTIQQGENPEAWWVDYLKNPEFRFKQELQAYRVQYRFMKNYIKDREKRARFLRAIAGDLSGRMYGNVCSLNEAMQLIKDEA
jgi:hypothetical protein